MYNLEWRPLNVNTLVKSKTKYICQSKIIKTSKISNTSKTRKVRKTSKKSNLMMMRQTSKIS